MSPIPRSLRAVATPVLTLAAVVLLFAAGCSSDDDAGPVGPPPIYSSITITGPDTVLIDDVAVFTAVVLDTAGQVVTSPQITWSTNLPALATVNNAGVAQGKSEGDVEIRATGGGTLSNAGTLAVIQGYGWVDQSAALASLVDLHGVHFVNERQGWIVGALGSIFVTADAGKTWATQSSFSTGYTLNAVSFATTTIGTIVGSAGHILRTTNGGASWAVQTSPSGGMGLNDVFFQDADRGWIVGNGGVILRTSNGGASWTRVLPGVTAVDLHSVSFPDATGGVSPPPNDPYGRGWIVGDGGTILTSDDFGQSWRIVTPFAVTDNLLAVKRATTGDAIAVGTNNRVLFTTASGDTALWNLAAATTPFTNFTSVAWPVTPLSFLPGSAWAGGKRSDGSVPVLLYSNDGGQSWIEQLLPNDAPLTGNGIEDVFFRDGQRGWAVGTSGLVLHTATGGR